MCLQETNIVTMLSFKVLIINWMVLLILLIKSPRNFYTQFYILNPRSFIQKNSLPHEVQFQRSYIYTRYNYIFISH